MKELLRTNDLVLISFVRALLAEADIEALYLDNHMSLMEGSLGALPRRILVDEDDLSRARRILSETGLAHELRELR
jgi:hypothetical protein